MKNSVFTVTTMVRIGLCILESEDGDLMNRFRAFLTANQIRPTEMHQDPDGFYGTFNAKDAAKIQKWISTQKNVEIR